LQKDSEVNKFIFNSLHWICRLVLGGTFLLDGYLKWEGFLQFSTNFTQNILQPNLWLNIVMEFIPCLELALGALLLVGCNVKRRGIVASTLLYFSIGLIAVVYFQRIDGLRIYLGAGNTSLPDMILHDSAFLLSALFLFYEQRIRDHFPPLLVIPRTNQFQIFTNL
jgi:uncharacterized membrane protein YphA (DoxX/SURF4 family)